MTRSLSRHRYLELLRAALAAQHYRFARQAALDWLSIYPGDLSASLCYSRALIGERRLPQAIAILQGLRRVDPEYVEAVEALVTTDAEAGGGAGVSARAHYHALTGRSRDLQTLASWGGALWSARQALDLGNLELAGELIGDCLRETDNLPLAGVLHLRYLAASDLVDAPVRREVALSYHQRWPDCIACILWLAQWSMEIGEADYAVALLHQAVSRDTGGQVAQRLWGAEHPYRALWPERLEHVLSLPVPADVTVWLGSNRLAPGESPAEPEPVAQPEQAGSPEPPAKGLTWSGGVTELDGLGGLAGMNLSGGADGPQDNSGALLDATPGLVQLAGLEWALSGSDAAGLSEKTLDATQATGSNGADPGLLDPAIWNAIQPGANGTAPVATTRPGNGKPSHGKNDGSKPQLPADPDLGSVSLEFDRLARRLKLPAVGRQDGRFPVYVIFSVQGRLEAVYGQRIADLLVSEMQALADAVDRRKGWSARMFLPDNPAWLSPLGMAPIRSVDPWELKLALVDLDAVLTRRGERIGAVLIIGGPEIVPFHCLPNPVDDQDDDIPTDNPYATRDENYFIPEWPVGRLPGGQGEDARVILGALQRIRRAHEASQQRPSWLRRFAWWLRQKLARPAAPAAEGEPEMPDQAQPVAAQWLAGRRIRAFGYTAAIWKQAASLVFRPIGKPAALSISPPFGLDGASPQAASEDLAAAAGKIPALRGKLAYFNLHGLVDAPEWYGQRDPLGNGADPDYPVALRPKDILLNGKNACGDVPQIVFSEACYGLHIQGREAQEAISLSFLQAGTLAVVGSTCMAYGSIAAPLAAADLLGHTFWRYLHEGFPAGEALRQAKIHLASLMSQRQGYLDGEDQKTLISFILFGDPLAQPLLSERAPKSLRYQTSSLAEVPTVCERLATTDLAEPLPAEVIAAVRRVVAHHLPGMSDARLTLVHPRATCPGEGHACPTSQLEHPGSPAKTLPQPGKKRRRNLLRQSKNAAEDSCSLVTLSKQITLPNGVHPRVARLTLDERGKLVKLVVSR